VHKIPSVEILLRRIEWTNGALLVLAILGAWAFYSAKMAFDVLLGGAIVTASFQTLKWQLNKAFRDPGKIPSKGKIYLGYYLRFAIVLFLIFVVMHYGWKNPIAFVVGLSVIAISILLIGGLEFLVLVATKGES
jgi:hypothetical protein